eukprot:scaffold665615_cov59-Prasinocladus_malaysianus.AAC.1
MTDLAVDEAYCIILRTKRKSLPHLPLKGLPHLGRSASDGEPGVGEDPALGQDRNVRPGTHVPFKAMQRGLAGDVLCLLPDEEADAYHSGVAVDLGTAHLPQHATAVAHNRAAAQGLSRERGRQAAVYLGAQGLHGQDPSAT